MVRLLQLVSQPFILWCHITSYSTIQHPHGAIFRTRHYFGHQFSKLFRPTDFIVINNNINHTILIHSLNWRCMQRLRLCSHMIEKL